jgi:mono/diheme cytochrome c family protein
MVRIRALKGPLALVPATVVLVALGGCAVKHPTSDLANGKLLFINHCSSCHTLAHANAQGTVGPNLDDAFRQDRADGVKSTSIEGLVDYWIRYPNKQGVMPAMLVSGQDAQDVAAYVAHVAAIPGQDGGELANIGEVKQKPVTAQNGVLQIDADPNGQLKFLASSASAPSGQLTIHMKNASSVPHDIAIRGNGVSQVGQVVSNGGTSTVTENLKPGTYTFYCSVPGHRQSGMEGTLHVS